MRKIAIVIIFLIFRVCLLGQITAFQSPSFDRPYYRIVFPLEVSGGSWILQGLKVNGQDWPTFFVFQEGEVKNLAKPLEEGRYTVEVDYAWRSGRNYTLEIFYQRNDSNRVAKKVIRLQSPKKGGIPVEAEGFYRIFRAEEPVGIEREGEICLLTVTVAKQEMMNSGFILFDGKKPISLQVLTFQEATPPPKSAATHPVTLTYRLAFPLDIKPYQKKMLLLLRGKGEEESSSGFEVTGEGLGKRVRNKYLSLEFHPQSGQLNTFEDLKQKIRLFNKVGVLHWNPGVHIPGIAWDHSFNWNPPPSFKELVGRYLYISTRRGRLQRIKDVRLEVRYILETGTPYFISETLLTVKKDLGVSAIRNDEMVFYHELFDTLIYKDKQGRVVKKTLQPNPSFPDGLVYVAPDDVDWVGLVNSQQRFGFFSLRLAYAHPSLDLAGSWLNKPGTYFYAPANGKYVYWVRPLLYTWSEYPTRNLLTYVPAGSQFYEKNAYLILPVDETLGEKLDHLLKRLKNPVRVY
jgi:hypothetical protein